MAKHPAELRELIWSMLCSGMKPTRVLARINSGENELERSFELPASTFWDLRRTLVKQRGEPTAIVQVGEEEAAIGAILRRWLGLTNRALDDLESRINNGDTPRTHELDRVAKLVKTAAYLKDNRQRTAGQAKVTASRETASPSLLDELAGRDEGTAGQAEAAA